MTANELFREYATITTDAASIALTTAVAEGHKLGIAITAAVVGPTTNLIGLLSADGATPHSVFTCQRKAVTSSSTKRPSGWMPPGLAVELPMASNGMLTNVAGGVPLKINGVLIGGLGIAGGSVEQDALIATAVLTALGADPI